MDKKEMSRGLNSLIGGAEPEKLVEVEKPKKAKPAPAKQEIIRATFMLPKELKAQLEGVAWYERQTISKTLQQALEEYVANWLERNKKKRVPKVPAE